MKCAVLIYRWTLISIIAYWIQVSGASALAVAEFTSPSFSPGSASSEVIDDIEDASKFIKLLRDHKVRAVDNYILDVGSQESTIETALVFPPIIYGVGEGVVNQRSIQIPELARVTLEKGHGVRVGPGLSRWGNVHIRDLGRLFGALVEAATKPKGDSKLWNDDGIYLTGVGEIVSSQVLRANLCLQPLISLFSLLVIYRPRLLTQLLSRASTRRTLLRSCKKQMPMLLSPMVPSCTVPMLDPSLDVQENTLDGRLVRTPWKKISPRQLQSKHREGGIRSSGVCIEQT